MNYHSSNICKKHIDSTDELIAIRKVTSATKPIVEPILDCEANREGRNRNPYDWTYSNITLSNITDRGYTGHEHLDVFGLINANARMYEPATGRFLTADPYVQAPAYSQNYNRYSYCFNNPLVYTDPSGEIAFPLFIGMAVGMHMGSKIAEEKGATGYEFAGYVISGAAIGAATVVIGAYTTSGLLASSASGSLTTIAGGSLSGGFNSTMFSIMSGNWDNWYVGFVTGGIGSGVQGYFGGIEGAIFGGMASSASGSLLRGEKDLLKIVGSAMLSGVTSALVYEINFSRQYNGVKNEMDITKSEFRAISKGSQSSFFRGIEFGAAKTDQGFYTSYGSANSVNIKYDGNLIWAYHTHPGGTDRFSGWDDLWYERDYLSGKKYIDMVGTRQGNIHWRPDPYTWEVTYNYNFSNWHNSTFYPFTIFKF